MMANGSCTSVRAIRRLRLVRSSALRTSAKNRRLPSRRRARASLAGIMSQSASLDGPEFELRRRESFRRDARSIVGQLPANLDDLLHVGLIHAMEGKQACLAALLSPDMF